MQTKTRLSTEQSSYEKKMRVYVIEKVVRFNHDPWF